MVMADGTFFKILPHLLLQICHPQTFWKSSCFPINPSIFSKEFKFRTFSRNLTFYCLTSAVRNEELAAIFLNIAQTKETH